MTIHRLSGYRSGMNQQVSDGLAGICLGIPIAIVGVVLAYAVGYWGAPVVLFGVAAVLFGLMRAGMGLLRD